MGNESEIERDSISSEIPERAPREPEGFGEDRGFGRERAEAEGELGAEAEPE